METREQWLTEAVGLMAEKLGPLDLDWSRETKEPLVEAVRVSIGYPRRRRYADKNCMGGDALPASMSKDGIHEIFIPPTIVDEMAALECLEHQVCHIVAADSPHNVLFPSWERKEIADKLGPMPHAPVSSTAKTADTRMLLAQCPNPECHLITSRGPWQFRITKGRANQGLPNCPGCGEIIVLA